MKVEMTRIKLEVIEFEDLKLVLVEEAFKLG